jgi:hypothetical protein
MSMQHVNLKIFAKTGQDVNVADAIPVFHRWIQKRDLPELLIDVADYSQVPEGPGVLLIAHEANYSLDYARDQLGLLYNRKAAGSGDAQEQLRQAYDAALNACQRLEQEPEFRGKLMFDADRLEIVFNDRLLHPNTDESWNTVKPDAVRFFDGIFGAGQYVLERRGEPRERLRAMVRRVTQ